MSARRFIGTVALSFGLCFALAASAHAATLTVATTADTSASQCTLRDAIESTSQDANQGACVAAGGYGADTINVTASPTITLGSALPAITDADGLLIDGPGRSSLAVSGGEAVPVLTVEFEAVATVRDLTISDGLGAGSQGGGVVNSGTLTLERVTVRDNEARDTGGNNAFAEGGGIQNSDGATLTLVESTVTDNSATASNASNQNGPAGGGIMNRGTAILDRSIVTNNHATAIAGGGDTTNANGGGIANNAVLDVLRSTISGNDATATGGASGNSAEGGGISNANSPDVDVEIDRSTISGNTASASGAGQNVSGGGFLGSGSADVVVQSSTFTANSASSAANVFSPTGTFANTIVTNPQGAGENCAGATGDSAGYNLEDTDTCDFDQATDEPNTVAPGLDPNLADNGGPTPTHALLPGSPAVDAGLAAALEDVDQRGLPRPFDFPATTNAPGGDGSDIGAFELHPPPVPTEVTLKASKKRVKKGRKVRFTVTAAPCPGRAGDPVQLRRGSRTIRQGTLDASCQAKFKVKIRKRSRFHAVVPAELQHLEGVSNKVRIRIKRRRR